MMGVPLKISNVGTRKLGAEWIMDVTRLWVKELFLEADSQIRVSGACDR